MKKLIALVVTGLMSSAAATSAVADTLGLQVGGGYWQPNVDGDVVANVNVEDELDIEDIGSAYFYFNFEHPLPLVPNLRVARTHIDKEGNGRLNTNFTFEGQNFIAGQRTKNKLDLSNTDFTFYYELWDTSGDLDVGVTARWFKGEVDIGSTVEENDLVLPMLYVRAEAELPFTGFYAGGLVNTSSYSGDSIVDGELKIGWRKKDFILPDFGVELGYRRLDLDVDDSVDIDLDLSGAFININGNF
ncbi:MAG: TIGR04219 family outer membrane beta-barrel protein [Pseudomonadales bacterium]